MNKPDFPYKGNQVIISSGRVMLHAKDDMIFLFGKKGVGVSTNATFNVDALERTIINSQKIELGLRAEKEGEPVLKGTTTIQQLGDILLELSNLGAALEKMAVEGLPAAVPGIKIAGGSVKNTAKRVRNVLMSKAKSQVTYTK